MSDNQPTTSTIRPLASEIDDVTERDTRRQQAERLVAALDEDELGLLRQIVGGWSKTESATHFNMTIHQLDKIRARLFAKLNAASTTDAVRIGIYAGLR